MAIDTKHEDLQSLRIDRTQRGDNGGEPPAWARRYILGGIAVVVLLGLFTLAYRMLSSDVPEVEVVRASVETSGRGRGRYGALGDWIHRGPPHHQREFQSHRTPGMDRRGKRRQSEGRPGAGAPRGSGIPSIVTSRPRERSPTLAHIWKSCSTARVRRKSSRRSTISTKRAPPLANDKLTLDRTKELAAAGVVSRAGARRCHRQIRIRPAACQLSAAGICAGEDRSAPGGNCPRSRRAGAGAGPTGLCQVPAGRNRHPRACHRHHPRSHRGERRVDHGAVCQRRGGWSAGIGRLARRPERSASRTRYRAG